MDEIRRQNWRAVLMKRTPIVNKVLALTAILAISIGAAACSSDGGAKGASVSADGQEARHYVEDFYRAFGESGDMTDGLYRTLDETLPNVTYARSTGNSVVTTHVVVGRIKDVQKGKGFRVEGDDGPDGTPTDFDDSQAKWWTIHASVEVEHAIASSVPDEITVMFPAGGPSDFGKMQAGLKALGRVVLFLRNDSPLTAYDRNLYWVNQDFGVLVATVADDGALGLPLLVEARATKLLAKTRTFADLEASARVPKVIPVVPTPGNPAIDQRADGL